MEDDPLFWQSFYGDASERHANLYHEKAVRSFDLEKMEWINRSEVEGEGENLSIAITYFDARLKEEIRAAQADPNDQEKLGWVKSFMMKHAQVLLVSAYLWRDETTVAANQKYGEVQALADQMMNDANKLDQDVSKIYEEAKESVSRMYQIYDHAEDMVQSLGRPDPAQEIERFIVRHIDPLEFRWDAIPLLVRWLPPQELESSKRLVSRRGEEAHLLQILKRTNRIGLYGPVGSGKTTLLLRLWNNAEMTTIFPNGGIWIQAARFSSEDIPGIIASALSETLARSSPLIVQATEVFHLLNGKKAMIILDGATSRDEVDIVMKCVPQSCTLLVTSSSIRCLQLLNGETVTFGSLGPTEGVALLRDWCGESGRTQGFDPTTAEEICRELAGLPLAIEMVGRYVRQSGRNLQHAWVHLRSLNAADISSGNRALHKALALCITRLSDDSVDLLNKLSGMRIKYFSQDILQAIHNSPGKAQLSDLLELGLIRCDQPDEFYLVPLLSVVLNNRLHQDILQGSSGAQIFGFLQTYFSANAPDHERLERVRRFFAWVMDYAPKHEFAGKMVELVRLAAPFLMNAGYWSTLSRALATGLECSQLTGDLEAENFFSCQIAFLHYHQGREELALNFLRKKTDSLRRLEEWSLLLMALYIMGRVFEGKGELKQASSFYQQALDLPTVELITQIHIAYHQSKVEALCNNPQAARKANQFALNAIKQYALFSRMYNKKSS